MSTIKTSVVIPAYFADYSFIDMTKACLDSLEGPNQVIVVDDGSPMGYEQFDADMVILPENKGYAGAVNAGLKEATGDILIISNNDIIFYPGWLEALYKPLTLGYDISSIRTTDQTGWATEDKITEGDKFGSLWAMKRKVYETLGGLDERYGKGYFEDLDYRRRAFNAGFRVGKNHAGLVEHLGKATFRQVDPDDRHYLEAMEIYRERWGEVE